jgi:hypothetical protein
MGRWRRSRHWTRFSTDVTQFADLSDPEIACRTSRSISEAFGSVTGVPSNRHLNTRSVSDRRLSVVVKRGR